MCGIAGIIGSTNIVNQSVAQTLARSLAHRGPDYQGIELLKLQQNPDTLIALVHRRLSIIDLTQAAHQPMKDPSTGNIIIYNGEVYNFKELRQELEAKGIEFHSKSDTEVVLKAYQTFGPDFLHKLRGMFAFAIWDHQKQKLLLARDRLGIKTLYYYTGENGLFVFASELRALLATGLIPKKLDPIGLDTYLAYGAVQAPSTIIRKVNCLLPAHYLEVSSDGIATVPKCYWSVPFAQANATVQEEHHLIDQLRNLLKEVVTQHLISDVPLGLFLSGGVDSSSIAILLNQVAQEPPHTFSITFSESRFSEASYSHLIAQKFSKHHTEICLSEQQLLSLLPDALTAIDQPTIDGINVYVISKAVREEGIKAAFSGQGGDEIFAGYSTFRRISRIARYQPFFKLIGKTAMGKITKLLALINNNNITNSKISQILQSNGDILSTYLALRQLFSPSQRRSLCRLNDPAISDNGLNLETTSLLKDRLPGLDPINQISLLELQTYLANMLLRDGDFMSMAHGLEIRVPFLDHRLVEFVARIPGKYKTDDSLPKPLLLKAIGNALPSTIYQRPKNGFTFPWPYWLRGKLKNQLDEVFYNDQLFTNIGLDSEKCRTLWSAFAAKKTQDIMWSRVWGLFVLAKWCNQFQVTL